MFNPPILTQHTNFYALLSKLWCNWKSWIPVSGHDYLLILPLQSNVCFDHIEILSILFSFHSSLFHQFPLPTRATWPSVHLLLSHPYFPISLFLSSPILKLGQFEHCLSSFLCKTQDSIIFHVMSLLSPYCENLFESLTLHLKCLLFLLLW